MPYPLRAEPRAALVYARQETTGAGDTGVPATTPEPTTTPVETTTTPVTTTTPITTTTPETTTTPITTTPVTTTTPISTPDDTTTPVSATTTPAGGSTTAAGTTTAGASSLPASITSMKTATMVVTSNGQIITTVITTTPTTIASSNTSKSSSSNTGPIVGGVVGGIAALGLLALLFYCLRKRSKNQNLEGDIFDPDRNVQRPGRLHGGVDLADPQMEAHPYSLPGSHSTGPLVPTATGATAGLAGVGAATAASRSSRDQSSYYNHHGPAPGEIFNHPQAYGESPYPVMAGGRPPSGPWAGASDLSRGPSSGSGWVPSPSTGYPISNSTHPTTDDGRSGVGAAFLGIPAGSGTHSSGQSAKARQAQGLHLANVDAEDQAGPVMQHQDGGRVQPQSSPQEVPPSYDSIPVEQLAAGGSSGPSEMSPEAAQRAREEAARPEKAPRPLS